jgi:hypothetical protein
MIGHPNCRMAQLLDQPIDSARERCTAASPKLYKATPRTVLQCCAIEHQPPHFTCRYSVLRATPITSAISDIGVPSARIFLA